MEILLGARNFGKIAAAEVCINRFSVFVGNNNSGKTYMMQLIYGVRKNLRKYVQDFQSAYLEKIKKEADAGKVLLDAEAAGKVETYLNEILAENKEKIVFDTFNERIEIDQLYLRIIWTPGEEIEYVICSSNEKKGLIDKLEENLFGNPTSKKMLFEEIVPLAMEIDERATFLVVNLVTDGKKETDHIALNIGADGKLSYGVVMTAILDLLLGSRNDTLFLPASRTGLLALYKEFFAQKTDETVKVLSSNGEKNNNEAVKMGLTQPVYEFIRFVQTFTKDSQIDTKNMELVQFIESNLLDGKIWLDKGNQVLYQDKSSERPLPLYLSSSMINELTPVLYALESTQHPRTLIWDEIETSLHPQKQVELVRLLSRMSNSGISLIVSTHSDTMATKINNLCILSYARALKDRRDEILSAAGLEKEDLLKNSIYVYQFVNKTDGKSLVSKLEFNEYTGYEFTQFNDSVEKLFLETKMIME